MPRQSSRALVVSVAKVTFVKTFEGDKEGVWKQVRGGNHIPTPRDLLRRRRWNSTRICSRLVFVVLAFVAFLLLLLIYNCCKFSLCHLVLATSWWVCMLSFLDHTVLDLDAPLLENTWRFSTVRASFPTNQTSQFGKTNISPCDLLASARTGRTRNKQPGCSYWKQ